MKKLSLCMLLLSAALWLPLPVYAGNAGSPSSIRTLSLPSDGIQVTQDYHPHPPKPYTPPPPNPGPQVTQLQTVPAVPGVTFQIAGQQFTTGADGSTYVMVPEPGD